MMRNIENNQT